jgi:hypothetical protein
MKLPGKSRRCLKKMLARSSKPSVLKMKRIDSSIRKLLEWTCDDGLVPD